MTITGVRHDPGKAFKRQAVRSATASGGRLCERVGRWFGLIVGFSPEDVQKLVHELQVHQIELEMQNDELRRAQLALEESRDRYLDLYDFASVGYFTVGQRCGCFGSQSFGAGLLGIERGSLIGKPLTSFVHKESQDTFYFHRNQVLQTGTRSMCEIKLVKPDGAWFHAQLESVAIADSHGEFSRFENNHSGRYHSNHR